MAQRHVALLHYSAPPIVGGVESVLAWQARLMAAAGHAVTVIAGRGDPQIPGVDWLPVALLDSRHPRVLAVKCALDRGERPDDFAALQAAIAAALAPALAGHDLVIAHNVCSLHKNLALTAALAEWHAATRGPALVLWHHDLAWTTPRYRGELHPGFPWDLLRTAWPGARQVVVSERRRQELAALLDLSPEQITVVPNGVDAATLLKLEPQTEALRRVLNLDAAGPLLLLPVRLTPRKNIELALRVLAALRAEWPDAVLVVTGPEGPHNPANAGYRRELFALRAALGLETAAHFLAEHVDGFVADAVVADFYRLADALFLPSREEGFGIPLIEAAYTRLPVFCSRIAPLDELGGADVTYFDPDGEPAEIAVAIRTRLAGDPAYRFATRARRRYSWERVYTDHIAPLLAELAAPGEPESPP